MATLVRETTAPYITADVDLSGDRALSLLTAITEAYTSVAEKVPHEPQYKIKYRLNNNRIEFFYDPTDK